MASPTAPERGPAGVEPKLANIEIGEIAVVPELSDIWCPNSRTKPHRRWALSLARDAYDLQA